VNLHCLWKSHLVYSRLYWVPVSLLSFMFCVRVPLWVTYKEFSCFFVFWIQKWNAYKLSSPLWGKDWNLWRKMFEIKCSLWLAGTHRPGIHGRLCAVEKPTHPKWDDIAVFFFGWVSPPPPPPIGARQRLGKKNPLSLLGNSLIETLPW
jgi:hypothetical protein